MNSATFGMNQGATGKGFLLIFVCILCNLFNSENNH